MKIVLIENCVEHSANFIIYKGDGDLSLQVIIGLCKHKEAAALKLGAWQIHGEKYLHQLPTMKPIEQ